MALLRYGPYPLTRVHLAGGARAPRIPEAQGLVGSRRTRAARAAADLVDHAPRGGRRPGLPAEALLRRQEQRGRPDADGPECDGRAAVDAPWPGEERDRGRRAAADRVQPGDAG